MKPFSQFFIKDFQRSVEKSEFLGQNLGIFEFFVLLALNFEVDKAEEINLNREITRNKSVRYSYHAFNIPVNFRDGK